MKPGPALVVLFLSLLAAGTAQAQTDDGRLRDQLRQVTLQLRQLQDDQATLQAQKAAAETERDAVKKQLAAAQADLSRARREGGRADVAQQDLAKTKDALNQAAEAARQSQAEQDKLQASVASTATLLSACENKNTQLLAVGHEILAAYQEFDFGDAIGANEPFTRLERVKLENLAQGFEDRIEDGRYDSRAVHPQPQAGAKAKGNTP